jgi:hypothetical protein
MKAYESGRGEDPIAILRAAELRKLLLTKILEGNMRPEEKTLYYKWRDATKADRR